MDSFCPQGSGGKWPRVRAGLLILGALACLDCSTQCPKAPVAEAAPGNIPVATQLLETHIRELTGIRPPRNSRNTDSLNLAAQYIAREFSRYGYAVEFQKYQAQGAEYKNVLASAGPADAPRVIVGAHYDVCQDTPGADDNASGVAGLLEIARLVTLLHPELNRRIDFAAYSLEEPPFYGTPGMGSAVHARSLADKRIAVRAVIVLEMLGYYSDQPQSQTYPAFFFHWFYPDKADYLALVSVWGQEALINRVKNSMVEIKTIPVQTLTGPAFLQGLDFSDHRNYWPYHYPAIMVTDTSFYRNPHYHQRTDMVETLDLTRLGEAVRSLYWAVCQEASRK